MNLFQNFLPPDNFFRFQEQYTCSGIHIAGNSRNCLGGLLSVLKPTYINQSKYDHSKRRQSNACDRKTFSFIFEGQANTSQNDGAKLQSNKTKHAQPDNHYFQRIPGFTGSNKKTSNNNRAKQAEN